MSVSEVLINDRHLWISVGWKGIYSCSYLYSKSFLFIFLTREDFCHHSVNDIGPWLLTVLNLSFRVFSTEISVTYRGLGCLGQAFTSTHDSALDAVPISGWKSNKNVLTGKAGVRIFGFLHASLEALSDQDLVEHGEIIATLPGKADAK
ncbi:hypothetical protein ACFX13_013582 [Malus domestica]